MMAVNVTNLFGFLWFRFRGLGGRVAMVGIRIHFFSHGLLHELLLLVGELLQQPLLAFLDLLLLFALLQALL